VNGDTERSRPAIWGPVLIAAIFLAIIGASAGWVIGHQRNQADNGANRSVNEQPIDQSQGDPGGDPAGDGGQQDGGNDGGGGDGGDAVDKDHCPQHTQQLAGTDLDRVLYIRTEKAQVWICTAADGTLFYQGHLYLEGDRLVENDNALFLTDVRADGDAYVATNRTNRGTTVYRVSRKELVQGKGDGSDDKWPVLETRP
jgi:hypothetical protein